MTGDGVTLDGLLVHGPEQAGAMSGWKTNRALFTGGGLTGLSVTGNTWHTLRTGAYPDSGSGALIGNTTYNTKGDHLVAAGGDYAFTGNRAGDPERTSEWGIVVFAANEVAYDVEELAATNPA